MARIPLTKSRNMQSNEAQIQNQKTIGLCPVRPEPGKLNYSSQIYGKMLKSSYSV